MGSRVLTFLLFLLPVVGTVSTVSAQRPAAPALPAGKTPAQGALNGTLSGHWAFRPVRKPPIPKVKATARVRTPIDAFLLAALEQKGLSFAPEADRRILLRRVTYDLIGLPPTPREIETFLSDARRDAYERVVDRLLADPRYGEHWARHWLDTAGYADSEGVLQEDLIRPNAWRYRDYVIRSFNSDKPYDRFLQEQIAGDELTDYRHAAKFTPEIEEAITATGFLRTAVDATRDDFNTHQYTEYQYRMLHDTQTIVASCVMGITLQCARCHDHKYEPLTQRDYYRVQALFQGAIRPAGALLPSKRRQITAAGQEEQRHAAEVNAEVEAALKRLTRQEEALLQDFRRQWLESPAAGLPPVDKTTLLEAAKLDDTKRTPEQKALAAKYKNVLETPAGKLAEAFPEFKRQQAAIVQARSDAEKKRIVYPEIRALYDLDASPPPTPLLTRGDWTRPGDAVAPGIPAVLDDPRAPFQIAAPPPGAATTGRRLAFAKWLTRRENPLTARVLVNRVWAYHFGAGLVPTVENFGVSGEKPTNPALLDWLAATFMDETDLPGGANGSAGWRLKPLQRLIVTSAAYRQSSVWRRDGDQKDGPNRLLWRQRARRLEAEAIRDGMLAVAGNLDATMYGEPVGIVSRPSGEIVTQNEEQGGRRSLYILVRRSQPVNLLNAFDAPVIETNCTRRIVSTTAIQALALMNSSFLTTQAQQFARRVLKEIPALTNSEENPQTIEAAYRLALSRPPTPAARAASLAFVRGQIVLYARTAKTPAAAREAAYADFCQALLSANEFVYVD